MQKARRGTLSAILYMSQWRYCHNSVGSALGWGSEVYGSKSDSRLFLPDASLEAAPDIYQENATNLPGYAKHLKHSLGVPEGTVSYNKLAKLHELFSNSIKLKGMLPGKTKWARVDGQHCVLCILDLLCTSIFKLTLLMTVNQPAQLQAIWQIKVNLHALCSA